MKFSKLKQTNFCIVYLFVVLFCEIFIELSWIIFIAEKLYYLRPYYDIFTFIIKFAWACEIIKFQALALFIESLITRKYKISGVQYLFLLMTSFIIIVFTSMNLINYIYPMLNIRAYIISSSKLVGFYSLIILFFQVINILLYDINNKKDKNILPRILKKQISLFLKFLIIPYIFFQTLEIVLRNFEIHIQIDALISSPLLTFAIFYSLSKVMGLRFLNSEKSVAHNTRMPIVDNFKKALESLAQAMSFKELGPITQQYFHNEFGVPLNSVALVIRYDKKEEPIKGLGVLEDFCGTIDHQSIDNVELVHKQGILVKDEIAFTNFYETTEHTQSMLNFIDQLGVEVFIPIFDQKTLIGYITIEASERSAEFFSRAEQDQMIVYATYMGNLINLLNSQDMQYVLQENKHLQQELYSKHQQINQYKESLRTFLGDTTQRKIGLVIFKNRQFSFLNPQAKELVGINLNQDAGHPVSIEMKEMINRLEHYSTAQMSIVTMPHGTKLVINASFYGQKTSIIFTITLPEVSDLIKPQLDALNDPSEWDYLLYLQTTESGRLINQLLPGSTKHIINAKVELLKLALSTKALILDAADKDMISIVEIIHHISLAEQLLIFDCREHPDAKEQGILLFGSHQIIVDAPIGLLEQLSESGTLFIKNIHLLAPVHQEALANFIQYGSYAKMRSNKKEHSAARIIAASPLELSGLVAQQTFSDKLFKQLRFSILKIPSLLTLPKEELALLIEGYSAQAISSPFLLNAVRLSSCEQKKLIESSPTSIQEFKEKIKNVLQHKTKKSNLSSDISFNSGYHLSDPTLAEAVRLGKTSLKDERIMRFLWNKFNNQNKIASLLGVNRSSVNRRCKEFGLE